MIGRLKNIFGTPIIWLELLGRRGHRVEAGIQYREHLQ